MALLSSVESAPRAYRLKASNAASPFSTSIGTIPREAQVEYIKKLNELAKGFALDIPWLEPGS